MMTIIEHWMKKFKKTLEDRKTPHVHGYRELILLKWLYYQKWYTDLMPSSSKY